MTHEAEHHVQSVIVGDLKLPSAGTADAEAAEINPDEKVPMLIELNLRYPGGLAAVRQDFYQLWVSFIDRAGGSWPAEPTSAGPVQPAVPPRLALVAPKLYQCVLSRADAQEMVAQDRQSARSSGRPPVIFRVWPDYTLEPQIDRSAPTVKADAAWRSYDARGRGIVWAVIDSGIDACHPHFSALELAAEGRGEVLLQGLTSQLPGQPGQPGAWAGCSGPGTVRRERARHPRVRHHRRPFSGRPQSAGRGLKGSDGRRLCPASPRRPAVRNGAGL
jgi:hypothetical protein